MVTLKTNPGHPLPLGATLVSTGINFALAAKEATSVTLILYDLEAKSVVSEFTLDSTINKTGDIWHLGVETETNKTLGYAYRLDGISKLHKINYFDKNKWLVDPYTKAVASPIQWGTCGDRQTYRPLGLILPRSDFDWQNDRPLKISEKDLIIYEMHVRGFTQDTSSSVKAPGTFLGLIEKIPHLVELGVNAVELLPLQEFNECEYQLQNQLYQYWGYSTLNFFAPMNRYASETNPGAVIHEFKSMVKAFHQNGIAVILDMVFNHTNEGDEKGPVLSFKGIDRDSYYLMTQDDKLMNFTGCGNTFNTTHPLTQELILDALRYWVLEMHVDGFRFDLASIFYRGLKGEILAQSPIVEAISQDPILSKTLLISEPWDAAGFYQVGSYYPTVRWSEWNGRYRDTIRKFIKGDSFIKNRFASRLSGSQDIYVSKSPLCSINFVTCHDGFTLRDLVSFNGKHNLANGENNQDGTNHNYSWNCGFEGPSSDAKVTALRERQMRNFHLALMLSQGIPMIQMGDEYGHTKEGNNNTWCQDNKLNWFLWDQLQANANFYRFYRKLIEFRKQHSILHKGSFLTDQDIKWWGSEGKEIIWDKDTHFLAFTILDLEHQQHLFCAFNAQNETVNVKIPEMKDLCKWFLIIDTARESPNDIYEKGQEPPMDSSISMIPYSAIVMESNLQNLNKN